MTEEEIISLLDVPEVLTYELFKLDRENWIAVQSSENLTFYNRNDKKIGFEITRNDGGEYLVSLLFSNLNRINYVERTIYDEEKSVSNLYSFLKEKLITASEKPNSLEAALK